MFVVIFFTKITLISTLQQNLQIVEYIDDITPLRTFLDSKESTWREAQNYPQIIQT